MSASDKAPIIIKRKKIVVEAGHHGGAWKVAYADFVTAMMAFFMLMWLLNATTETQRKGLADYFSPTIPVSRISGGGDGALSGSSSFDQESLAQSGTGGLDVPDSADGEMGLMADVEAGLTAMGGESMASDGIMRHIVTRVTDRGLIVEFIERPGRALFEAGTAVPTLLTRQLAALVSDVFDLASNSIEIGAHVSARPVVELGISHWDLSTARAHAMRSLLEGGGIDPNRVARVIGHADRTPAVAPNIDPSNNRVELILLRADL